MKGVHPTRRAQMMSVRRGREEERGQRGE